MLELDPFTLVYQGLWALALQSEYIATQVSVGNRVDYSKAGLPVKATVAAADLPELGLVPKECSCNLHMSSSTSKVVRTYEWILSTGEFRLADKLFPLQFALLCAMTGWKSSFMTGLLWKNSTHFVKRLELKDFTDGESRAELNRGIRGWSSIIGVEVEMHFVTADLLGELIV